MSCGSECGRPFRAPNLIYYFSGTGNSRHVASVLAEILDCEKRFIPDTEAEKEIYEEGNIGVVFPVYSWGVPPLVIDFINRLSDSFWESLNLNQGHVWAVMTCGDEVALAPEMLAKALQARGVKIAGIWSVTMPNNYVLLPGFDVDPVELERKKLECSKGRISEVAKGIVEGMAAVDVTRGSLPWLKTKLVYPLFKKWGISPAKWHSTPSCIGCGKCESACPLKNVRMEEKSSPNSVSQERRPVWGKNCCSCLACYHICPQHAAEYGTETRKKGQYFFKSY